MNYCSRTTLSNVTNAFSANIPAIIANFIANPNNRSYQPRAYDRENYNVPERVFTTQVRFNKNGLTT